jgi:hypothetical protein
MKTQCQARIELAPSNRLHVAIYDSLPPQVIKDFISMKHLRQFQNVATYTKNTTFHNPLKAEILLKIYKYLFRTSQETRYNAV